MIILRIVLELKGFFDNIVNVKVPGMVSICFSYAGIKNANGCRILRLLYIGTNDEIKKQPKPALNTGESIFYAYAFVSSLDVLDALWAIEKHFSGYVLPYQRPATSKSRFDGVEILLQGNAIPAFFEEGDKRFMCMCK